MSSLSGIMGTPIASSYSASKFALVRLKKIIDNDRLFYVQLVSLSMDISTLYELKLLLTMLRCQSFVQAQLRVKSQAKPTETPTTQFR
jgi:hypothetical protein